MALFLTTPDPKFSGLIMSITPNRSRGIYDESTLSEAVTETVRSLCRSKGIRVEEGYMPGIGGATGPSKLAEWLLRTIPLLGRAFVALMTTGKILHRKLTVYRRKKLRPFEPSIGIHLDIWPKLGFRSRGESVDLSDTLLLLPELSELLSTTHPNVKAAFLVTSNSERVQLPPALIDADACSEATMVKLSTNVRKDIVLPTPHTHFTVSRRWGLWSKISAFRDSSAAFHMVHLFPQNRM